MKPPKSASAVAGDIEAFIPLEGLIDFEKERQRLLKEQEQVQVQIQILDKRLADPKFTSHAPEDEVVKTRQRKEENISKVKRLEEHLASIQ